MIVSTDTFNPGWARLHIKHMRQVWSDEAHQQKAMMEKLAPAQVAKAQAEIKALEREYDSAWRM